MIPNLTSPDSLQRAIDIAYGDSRAIAERERNHVLRCFWHRLAHRSPARHAQCDGHHSTLACSTQA